MWLTEGIIGSKQNDQDSACKDKDAVKEENTVASNAAIESDAEFVVSALSEIQIDHYYYSLFSKKALQSLIMFRSYESCRSSSQAFFLFLCRISG